MEKRTYTKLSNLTEDQKIERKRQHTKDSRKRAKERKIAELNKLPIPPKLYVNEGKSQEEIRKRKNDLDKSYRKHETSEEHEEYLKRERERKKISREKKLSKEDIKTSFIRSNINKHYLNRYLKLIENQDTSLVYEKHHILPSSLFPEYEFTKSNIVRLSYRSHYLAHWILTKLLPDNEGMRLAFYLMNKSQNYSTKRNSRAFETVKLKVVQDNREKGKKQIPVLLEQNKIRLSNGSHNFYGGKIQKEATAKRLAEGSHNFQGKNNPIHNRLKTKEHSENMRLIQNQIALSGKHIFQNIKPWRHNSSTKLSMTTWFLANDIFKCLKINPTYKCVRIFNYMQKENLNKVLSITTIRKIIKDIDNGWIPENDPEWSKFKKEEN